MHQSRLPKPPSWLGCSKCLCKIGIGIHVQSRLLNLNKVSLFRAWKRNDIKPYLPPDGSWKLYRERNEIKQEKELGWWGDNASEWMEGYKAKFPDWSYIWTKQKCADYQKLRWHGSGPGSNFRLKKRVRNRVYNAIKRANKNKKAKINQRTEKMIGCTITELRGHLESKFKRGMTWEGHGSDWHIDHVIPLSVFNLEDDSQLLTACHYRNLQPLWARENLQKSDRVPANAQIQMAI
jgi:hypothetical protein